MGVQAGEVPPEIRREAGDLLTELQALADGLKVWEGLGFRRVATLRGFLRSELNQ